MTNLDQLIRDLTKVHPLSKSEVRQRLEAFEVRARIGINLLMNAINHHRKER